MEDNSNTNKRVSRTIVITGITKKTDPQLLLDTFKPFGNINSVKVTKRLRNGREVRLGFVTFDLREEATKVIDKHNDTMTLDSRQVSLSYAVKGNKQQSLHKNEGDDNGKGNDGSSNQRFSNERRGDGNRRNDNKTKLFIKGLPTSYTETQISELFGKCTIVARNNEKKFLIADFESEENKKAVQDKMNEFTIDDEHKLVLLDAHSGKNRNFGRRRYFQRRNERPTMG